MMSLETRKKMSEAHKGKIGYWRGKKRPLEFCLKMKENFKKLGWKPPSHKGYTFTEECKKRISDKLKGFHSSPNTEFKKGENIGVKCHLWKGGINPLTRTIRTLFEMKQWIQTVFQRDNFTCQECFQRGGKLHAHHKKRFSVIFKEFLQQYSQFSPMEDRETLIRLAITYEPFWDLNNGKTLCKKCHSKYPTNVVKIRINGGFGF